jgi:hypothetical protein
MRPIAIISAVVLLALVALTLVPAAGEFRSPLSLAALAAGVLVLVSVLADRSRSPAAQPAAPAAAEALKPAAAPPARNQADAEVVSFLALLQEKGRFVDFLMDDITPYADAQVGAAARVVHQGCRAVLQEHVTLRPVRDEREGATVTVPAAYAADEYRLVGKIAGEAPFTGRLVHRGWRAETVKLPRVLRPADERLPTIAPAEVELS